MEENIRMTEMDDKGCMLLIEAVVRRAADDYLAAMRRRRSRRSAARMREAASFFRSDYFSRLTGADGNQMLEMIRKEGVRK